MIRKMYLIGTFIALLHMHVVITDQESCPSRVDNPMGQACQKPCKEDRDCLGKRRCLCDGQCGYSCVLNRSCRWPVNITNAYTQLVDKTSNFGDRMLVICNEGNRLPNGLESGVRFCQGDRRWSFMDPCAPVKLGPSCDPPPDIENGYFTKHSPSFWVGTSVDYKCNSGYRLEGHTTIECLENITWSLEAPTCKEIFCSPPTEINHGTLVAVKKTEYVVSEEIYYLCKKNFFLDGSNTVSCESNGHWSKIPACRARCKIQAQRSRVLYKGIKFWINEIPEGLVHHSEIVTFFCKSKNQTCSYPAPSECFDGILPLPECYEEPTWVHYNLFPKKVVSEITPCSQMNHS
ncbi:beta-2-glycoprotein 1 [Bombina bombina]|uniref:beta-2-glycoprotein 1 n=1 Tax=Bombina bombina TaxID=8345 RepID=UPI00235AEF97|nr:beta-2-glycoprotein 1 [Bombina bombina]